MERMIIFKEWLKTRWIVFGCAAVVLTATFYCLLNLSKILQVNGAMAVWSTLLMKDTVLIELLKYIPVAVGSAIALGQFIPEVQRKRVKLTLHLPYPRGKMIAMMYSYGFFMMAVIFGFQALALTLVLGRWMVSELVARVMATWAMWFIAGVAVYLFTTALCFEPTWKRRILIILVTAGFIHFSFLSSVPESYTGILPWVLIYVLCIQVLIYGGISRFKEGLQD